MHCLLTVINFLFVYDMLWTPLVVSRGASPPKPQLACLTSSFSIHADTPSFFLVNHARSWNIKLFYLKLCCSVLIHEQLPAMCGSCDIIISVLNLPMPMWQLTQNYTSEQLREQLHQVLPLQLNGCKPAMVYVMC